MRSPSFMPIALFALITGLFLFSCTTAPTNPYDISNTKIYLVARTTSQLSGNQGLADSIGNPITAGFSCNFPNNIDSVQLELALANGTDSIFKSFTNFSADTLWQTIVFGDTGIKTIKGVAYIKNYNKPYSDSIFVHIYGKPFNHAPVLRLVSGQTTINPKQICLLTLTAIDTDLIQKDSIMLLTGPFSRLNDSMFTWTPDSNSIGTNTAVFMAWDNGYPIMRDTLYVAITVVGTSVNHAPRWADKTINEVTSPGNAINLTLSAMCTDPDGDPLTFSLLAGAPSNDSIANAATEPTYTFMPGPGDTGAFYPKIVVTDSKGGFDTMTINLTIKTTPMTDTAKALTAFGFASPAASGTITESSKTVALTVPSGTDVTALVATFVSSGASVKVGTTVQTSGTTPNNFTSPVTYTVVAGDGGTQAYIVTVTVGPNTAKALTSFSFATPAVTGTITDSSKTVAISVPSGTNVTALKATFVSTGASVKVGTVVQTSGTTPNNFTSPVTYTVVAADGSTQAYVVTVTIGANPAKALTSFSFASPAATGTITESSKTVAISVPFGTDLTALVATFVSTGASVKVGTVVQTSGTTPNNFTSPVTYTVVAADGSTQAYVVTVTVGANTAKALTSFSFASPAATGTITESSKTVAISVPFGTDMTALVATFVSTGASVKVGTVVQTNGTTPNNFTSPVTYTVVAGDGGTQAYVVTVTVGANTAKALTSFSFASPAVSGTVTESSKTVALTVPFGTNVTALVATFVTTGASVKVGTVVQTSGTTPNNFTSPVTYTVVAADGSTQEYVVTVTIGPNTAIIIATQPQAQTKCVGSPVSFSVSASTAVGTLSYQWKNASGNLTEGHFVGTATNSLSISAVATGDAATYSCSITSTGGGSPVTSTGAILTVNTPSSTPTLAANVSSVCPPGLVTFTITGTLGTGAQWQVYAGGTKLLTQPTIASNSFTISNISAATSFSVKAEGGTCDNASSPPTSNSIPIAMNQSSTTPALAANITSVCPPGSVTFTITGTLGTGAQWKVYVGGIKLSTQPTITSNSFTISNISAATSYSVIAEGGTCDNASSPPTSNNVAISLIKYNVTFNANGGSPIPSVQSITCNGTATAPNPAPTKSCNTFAGWYYGTTAFSLTTTPITADITLSAQWTVNGNPTVSVTPSSSSICAGSSVSFSATASGGTAPYSYQWYQMVNGSANPVGTNSPSVSITTASETGGAGQSRPVTCYCVVTDNCSKSGTSNNSTVTDNFLPYAPDVEFSTDFDAVLWLHVAVWQFSPYTDFCCYFSYQKNGGAWMPYTSPSCDNISSDLGGANPATDVVVVKAYTHNKVTGCDGPVTTVNYP